MMSDKFWNEYYGRIWVVMLLAYYFVASALVDTIEENKAKRETAACVK